MLLRCAPRSKSSQGWSNDSAMHGVPAASVHSVSGSLIVSSCRSRRSRKRRLVTPGKPPDASTRATLGVRSSRSMSGGKGGGGADGGLSMSTSMVSESKAHRLRRKGGGARVSVVFGGLGWGAVGMASTLHRTCRTACSGLLQRCLHLGCHRLTTRPASNNEDNHKKTKRHV